MSESIELDTERQRPAAVEFNVATKNDVAGITRVYQETWPLIYPNDKLGSSTFADKKNVITEDDVKKYLEKLDTEAAREAGENYLSSPPESDRNLVAKVEGEIVGIARFRRLEDGSGELSLIHVLPTYQKFGIGSDLMKLGFAWLGRVDLSLKVAPYNYNAIGIYKHLGFVEQRETDGI